MSELWYALHVRPRFEKFVQVHLEDKGYEVFLPTYAVNRRSSDRVRSVALPLFPSYLFCRFNVNARLPILITPGVNLIVGAGKYPAAVDSDEILAIRRLTDAGVPSQPWPFLQVGQRVRVESGPLEGLVGIVVRSKSSDRLVVSVSLLMRSVSVEIDRSWVKPVTESPAMDTRGHHSSALSAR
jgi:transcription antitermination factor NusG